MTVIDQTIGPGLPGFLVTFALAAAAWLLFRSLTKHVRKVNHRAANPGAGEGPAADNGSGVVDRDGGGNEGADKAN